MKKIVRSLLCSGLMFIFLLHTLSPALAFQTNENDTETPILESIMEDTTYYTEEGKPLNQYDIVTSVTEDGVQVYGFFAEDGNIIASMLENEDCIVIAYTDGRMYTFEKNEDGHIDFSNVKKTITHIDYSMTQDNRVETSVPYATHEFYSNFFDKDGYINYSQIGTWHLYYDGSHVYSGDHPSKSILNACEDFESNIKSMDDHLYDVAETITGYVPGVSAALALAKLVEDPNWKTSAELGTQLILLIPQLSYVSMGWNTMELFRHMASAVSDHSAYKKNFQYVEKHGELIS